MKGLIMMNDSMEEYFKKGFTKKEREEYFNPAGVYEEVFYVSHNPKLPTFLRELDLYFRALAIAKFNKVDIIRCYNSWRLGYIGARLKKKLKIPLIISIHDDYDALWDNLGLNPFIKKLLRHTERKALDACDMCLVVSTYLHKYATLHGARNVEVVFNKLNLEQYNTKQFTVVSVGRLNPVKNHSATIEAVKLLRARGHKLRLLIIGNGSLEKNIRKELGEQDGLITTIPNTFLPMMLHECDCFCLPSLNEGFGIAFAEAQACGLPIIATNHPSVSDIVNRDNAIIINPVSVSEIANAILKIKQDKESRKRMIENGLRNCEKFEWNQLAQKEKEIIQKYTP